MTPFRHILAAMLLSFPVSGLWAQNAAQSRGLEPIEHIIEDRDPLRFSLRRVENGLGAMGQESRVYRNPQGGFGGESRVNLVSPGIWAESDRSQYVQITKGKLKGLQFQAIAPNTVFHLTPPNDQAPQGGAARQPSPYALDARVRGGIRVARGEGEPLDRNLGEVDPEIQGWRDYDRTIALGRRRLLAALDELREAAPVSLPDQPVGP